MQGSKGRYLGDVHEDLVEGGLVEAPLAHLDPLLILLHQPEYHRNLRADLYA